MRAGLGVAAPSLSLRAVGFGDAGDLPPSLPPCMWILPHLGAGGAPKIAADPSAFRARRERSKVPYIVRQCIEEVEKRGIEEVGIYRISGVATDIQALKAVFDASE